MVNADIHADIITGAMAYAEGSIGLIKFNKDLDVSLEAKKNADMEYPIPGGDNKQIVMSVPLPNIKIPVTANLKVNVVNGDISSLFCFKTKVQITS
jgi:hypothetical protein